MLELFLALKWPLIIFQGVFCLLLIIAILLQAGKGDDMASALSGQMGGGIQGSGGASKVLVRVTVIAAILFMVNSIALAKIFKEISVSSVGVSVSEPLAPATESPAASPGASSPTSPAASPSAAPAAGSAAPAASPLSPVGTTAPKAVPSSPAAAPSKK